MTSVLRIYQFILGNNCPTCCWLLGMMATLLLVFYCCVRTGSSVRVSGMGAESVGLWVHA